MHARYVIKIYIIMTSFLSEPSSYAIDFSSTDGKTGLEKDAVLRFLVALSGSATYGSGAVLGHQNDLWTKAPRQVIITHIIS